MGADYKVFILLQAQRFDHVGRIDASFVIVKHFVHRTTGLDDAIRRHSLAQQVITRNGTIGQIDVGSVIDDAAVVSSGTRWSKQRLPASM